MNIDQEILAHYLSQRDAHVIFPGLSLDAKAIIEMECLQIIQEIHTILADDSMEYPECFAKIEVIIVTLENHGICCGGRHDFG